MTFDDAAHDREPQAEPFFFERAVSAFNNRAGSVWNAETKSYDTPAKVVRWYKNHGVHSVIVGDDNYGEGSSREHAGWNPAT